jgi:thiamine biosynthesis lipoprotein
VLKKLICSSLLIILLLTVNSCGTQYQRFQTEFSGPFDTAALLIGYTESEAEFDRFAEMIYERINELHQLYDIYNAYDGVNNLYTVNENAGASPVEVDRDIMDMLLIAREGYRLSGGTVNVAMGPALRIWHKYRLEGLANETQATLPPYDALQGAAEITDIEDLIIDEERGTVFLRQAGMSLDVGAVAKGYAAGLAAKTAEETGLTSALLNVGGNITTIGKPLDGRGSWSIGIQSPELGGSIGDTIDTVYFNDMTLSISGGYQRFYVVDGTAYHHIIDPETLMPANKYKQVAVIHEDSVLADMLSTALFILPFEQGLVLAEKYGAEALWVDLEGEWKATDGYINISKTLGGEAI